MKYKSKFQTLWLIISTLFAIAAIVFVIMHFVKNSSLYLAISTGLASLFFLFKGMADYVDSKYCERKDRAFMRHMSYLFFGGSGICLILFIIQLIVK